MAGDLDNNPSLALTRRQKAPHRKSRLGCLTCKQRKLKCDETRPTCLRCLRNGYNCDGYPNPHLPITFGLPVPRDVWSSFLNPREKSAFQFFVDVTIDWFSNARECAAFWNPLVSQMLHHEPIIKHLALAIGSAHRMTWDNQCDQVTEEIFLTRHHDTALTLFNSRENKELSLVLTCSLLFCTLEHFRDRNKLFLKHMLAGIDIVREFEKGPKTISELEEERINVYIKPVLRKLELYSHELQKVAAVCLCPKTRPDRMMKQLQDMNRVPIPRESRPISTAVGPHESAAENT